MKKNKENKAPKKNGHHVETPEPPQVMDPSVPPVKKEEDDRKKSKQTRTGEKKTRPEEEKLAPAEEL